MQLRMHSGIATGVARGAECHPWQQKIAKNREKEGKNQEKSGGKIRKKRGKNQEEKAKIRKFLSLCPSWQIGLAMLLGMQSCKMSLSLTYNISSFLHSHIRHFIAIFSKKLVGKFKRYTHLKILQNQYRVSKNVLYRVSEKY